VRGLRRSNSGVALISKTRSHPSRKERGKD
jgi:hypothetical protein